MKTAVVGAGWSGLAAATALREAGCDVTVYETAHTPGGRAKRVGQPADEEFATPLDNGQHILLGAYTDTLALMRRLGRDPDTLFLRQPLNLVALDGGFTLAAPRLPAPWHAAVALLSARGLSWRDRLGCMRLMRGLRAAAWRVPQGTTVKAMLDRHGQSAPATRLLWEPLCLAALNTPIEQACAQLYANVLRDSLGGPRAATDILLPRGDLSALWPDAAAARVHMRYGHTVHSVAPDANGVAVDGDRYDAAVVAVPPQSAARMLAQGAAHALAAGLADMPHSPIATLTLKLAAPWPLPRCMMMLADDPARGHHGQWIFDKTSLAGHAGGATELAVVVSAAASVAERDRQQAIAAIAGQVREQAARRGLPPMPPVVGSALLIDKRATFLALPAVARPAQKTAWPGLALAGDWTDTGYPAVLEGAVRGGLRAAAAILSPGAH
ncbi:hydroxysqualene dehydroxylase HpnE [Bordetella genomosp. 11]|uniref:Amine oxidoreductase n=1 Tax=Bordetella genomosp. 11 TaxID=1416808 RepID=A0A261UIR2_9BORD|nr:hydroxysqualene dehydroxylase HpnE [Bordetella genomosp. 11]OZI61417.1 amine oxidoreductase [Bordetella genomosp. 11]